jgi:serine/threonine protein kinase
MSRGTSKTPQSQSAPFLSPESRGILLKGNSHDVALKKKKYAVGDVVARGKHGQVALGEGEVTPTTFSFAVKAQVIHHPPNFADRPYREYVIFKHLSKLRLQSEFYPNSHYSGFVRLLDWFTDATEQSSNHRTLNLVLEKAETTLGKVKKLSSYDYKCIIFQILFALNVAQSKYEFVHNDLHLQVHFPYFQMLHIVVYFLHVVTDAERCFGQNVLLKKPTSRTGPVGVFKDEDTQWYTAGQWIAKLSDFGLSRMKTEDDHIIFDTTRYACHSLRLRRLLDIRTVLTFTFPFATQANC